MNALIKEICYTVGDELGKGYNECIYQEGIALLLRQKSINYSKEVNLSVSFKNIIIGNVRADIVIPDEELVIECKAIDGNLKLSHVPQLIKYLKITNYSNGILVNFNQNPSKQIVELMYVEAFDSQNYKISFNDEIYCMNENGTSINI